jgi:hypothetical protein
MSSPRANRKMNFFSSAVIYFIFAKDSKQILLASAKTLTRRPVMLMKAVAAGFEEKGSAILPAAIRRSTAYGMICPLA